MEFKKLMMEIKSTGMKDQDLADLLSVNGDTVNQSMIYKWREGLISNEKIIRRYNLLLDIHKKLRRQRKIK